MEISKNEYRSLFVRPYKKEKKIDVIAQLVVGDEIIVASRRKVYNYE